MSTPFSTVTQLSTAQWLDNYLLQKGQMYTNTTTRLYYQPDPRIPGYNAYAAPFRSMVWDSGVAGATIFNSVSGYFFNFSAYTSSGSGEAYTGIVFPQIGTSGLSSMPLNMNFDQTSYVKVVSGTALQSGNSIFFPESLTQTLVVQVSGSGALSPDTVTLLITGTPVVYSRGDNGMMTDFVNGRALFPTSSVDQSAIISGAYSFKDFNIYFANQGGERMVFTDKYYLNSRFGNPVTGIAPPHTMVTPCIFVSSPSTEKPVLGFGGKHKVVTRIGINVLAENQAQLENALSLLATSRDLTFPQLPPSAWPLNSYGDFKSGYSYTATKAQYAAEPFYWITSARASKISDAAMVDQSIFAGRVDLTLEIPRSY